MGEGNLPVRFNVKLLKAQYYLGLVVLDDTIHTG